MAVLRELIDNQDESVVESWVGPTGTLHDFMHDSWELEVKTSVRPDPIASVHPIEQLEPIGLPFNLVIVGLRRDNDGPSLPEIVEEIRHRLESSNYHLTQFEETLLSSGYQDQHAESYSDARYSTSLMSRLPVDENSNLLSSLSGRDLLFH